jgi:hypothetical protein
MFVLLAEQTLLFIYLCGTLENGAHTPMSTIIPPSLSMYTMFILSMKQTGNCLKKEYPMNLASRLCLSRA